MQKKILFIISNLETGGVSKSMTSLMNVIDRNRYDVSLMIVSPHGAFMRLLPTGLNVITNPVWEALTAGPKGIIKLLKLGEFALTLGHIYRLLLSKISKARAGKIIARLMPTVEEQFDTIVDFNGQQQLYYMVDKLNAKKKVTFFHSDYATWHYYYSADKEYFPRVDYIFTVSSQCVSSLKQYFPTQVDKIGLMENISSLALIERMAAEEVSDINKVIPTLLTVGHVCENKGIYWAIEAAAILKDHHINFHWYFLGSVDKPEEYARAIEKNNVADRITFLGIRTNPYPYIRQATIIVHPSKFEGRSIALDEAKLLCKPVVVTDFSTVGDQFTNRLNASICQMTPESIASAIEELLTDEDLRKRYAANLEEARHDNSNEIEKLYTIFDA